MRRRSEKRIRFAVRCYDNGDCSSIRKRGDDLRELNLIVKSGPITSLTFGVIFFGGGNHFAVCAADFDLISIFKPDPIFR